MHLYMHIRPHERADKRVSDNYTDVKMADGGLLPARHLTHGPTMLGIKAATCALYCNHGEQPRHSINVSLQQYAGQLAPTGASLCVCSDLQGPDWTSYVKA